MRGPQLFAQGLVLQTLCLWASGCGPSFARLDGQTEWVLAGARVWDGAAEGFSAPLAMQIGRGRIVAMDPLDRAASVVSAAFEEGIRVVRADGTFVIPGLVNAHGHVGGAWSVEQPGSYEDYARRELERYARFGVTTVNSLGGGLEELFRLRDASWLDNAPPAARLLATGPVVAAETPAEGRARVAETARLQPDWIKLRVDDNRGASAKMPPDVYGAVINEAHGFGIPVAAHLFYLEDVRPLIGAGADLVAHSVRDAPVDRALAQLLIDREVCYVPTLAREVSAFAYASEPDFLDDEFLLADIDSVQLRVVRDPARQARIAGTGAPAFYRAALSQAQENLRVLAEAGVRIAFGTDSGPLGRFQGYFEHMEAALMAEAGLAPIEILRAATSVAAECLGLGDIGLLEAGNRADFIVLEEDPLLDIAKLRRIRSVYVGGKVVPKAGS